MKNLSLFVSAFALLSSSAYAAINCGTLPSCTSLGYSDTVTHCPKNVNGEEMVLKCPFDETLGKCIYEAAVGQIAYFTKTPNADSGWLLCDGKSYSYTKYPQLAKLIGTQFGGTVNNTFNVPDYRGFFLRVYAQGSYSSYVRSDFSTYAKGAVNSSVTAPQKEGLPNITGTFPADDSMVGLQKDFPNYKPSGAFQKGTSLSNYDMQSGFTNKGDPGGAYMSFAASNSSAIYGAQSGVTPPNMAVYAYIYAGKIVQ